MADVGRASGEQARERESMHTPFGAYRIVLIFRGSLISRISQFAKLIQLKFEPLHCHAHGQNASVKFFQQIPSKQLFTKI